MSIHPLLQFLFAFAFIVTVCILTYKLFCKCLDIMFQSNRSLKYACFLFALFFFACAIFAFQDFMKSPGSELSWFFPLLFLCSGIFIYIGTRKLDVSRLSQTVIKAEFSKQSAECLLKVLKREQKKLENFPNPDNECALSICHDLISKLNALSSPSAQTTFDLMEAGFLISALNHIIEDNSSLSKEELNIAEILCKDTKAVAVEGFGNEVLAHFNSQTDKNEF